MSYWGSRRERERDLRLAPLAAAVALVPLERVVMRARRLLLGSSAAARRLRAGLLVPVGLEVGLGHDDHILSEGDNWYRDQTKQGRLAALTKTLN